MTVLRKMPQIDVNMANSTGHVPLVASCIAILLIVSLKVA